MNLFLLIFFLVYGAGHAYLLLRLRMAWQLSGGWSALIIFWCVLMVCAPVATRLLERQGHDLLARWLALAGYCWMGWIFLFCSLALLLEIARALHVLSCYFVHLPRFSLFRPAVFVSWCMILASAAVVWGWFEALSIRTEQVRIVTDKLPAGSNAIRIVQVSDLHVGLIVQEKRVQRVLAAIRQAKPDLLVSTGDLVDGNLRHFDGVSALFRELSPPLGMLAIPGNHEYYVGYRQSLEFTEKSGFRMLRSAAQPVGRQLWVVGTDDPAGVLSGGFDPAAEARLLEEAPGDRFVLLLKHRPEVVREHLGLFDLQLSGHVHKGQIFPFNLLTWLRFPVRTGATPLEGGGMLYVNRGAGTWGPPVRFLAPPEVTVIELVPKN